MVLYYEINNLPPSYQALRAPGSPHMRYYQGLQAPGEAPGDPMLGARAPGGRASGGRTQGGRASGGRASGGRVSGDWIPGARALGGPSRHTQRSYPSPHILQNTQN